MDVAVAPDLARAIDARIRSGRYRSVSEAVDEALRQLLETELLVPEVVDLDSRVDAGLLELDLGQGIDGGEARERSKARLRTRAGA